MTLKDSLSTVPCWTTRLLPDEHSTPAYCSAIQAFLDVDWSATSLGPLNTWDYSTRAHITMMFKTHEMASVMFVGPESIVIYNSLCIDFYRDKHPRIMGMKYVDAFAEMDVLHALTAKISTVKQSGSAFSYDIAPIRLRRSADLAEEEVLVSWEFIPLVDDRNEFSSIFCNFKDHTQSIREKQRAQFLAALHDSLAKVTSYANFHSTVINLMQMSELHFPCMFIMEPDGREALQCTARFTSTEVKGLEECPRELYEAAQLALDTKTSSWTTINLEPLGTSVHCYVVPILQNFEAFPTAQVLIIGSNPEFLLDTFQRNFVKSCVTTIIAALSSIESSILLKQSETRYEEVLLRTTTGFNIEDEKTRLPVFVNDAWREMCQFFAPLDNIDTHTDFGVMVHPSHRKTFMEDYRKVSRDHRMHNCDVRLCRPYKPSSATEYHPDDSAWLKVSSCYLPRTYKHNSSILFTLTDISHSKYLERVTQEELDRSMEVQKLKLESNFERERADVAERAAAKHLQYIDFSSHELRNPLGAIMQAVDLAAIILQEQQNRSLDIIEVLDHLSSIVICAKHMGRIVDDTLSFSQLDHGALQIALVPGRLDETVLNVLTMFKAELNVKRIQLQTDIADTDMVLTDPSRFSQILINMLTNALKFAPHDGTGIIAVSLRASDIQDKIRFDCSVSDNGPGMTDDVLASLFQKCSQASAKTHVQYGGSGLGLYISKRLTELMGGEIQASSTPGQGSCLNFYIVAERTAAQQQSIKEMSRRQQVLEACDEASEERSRSTLLIVEDNLVNQRLMCKILGSKYTLHTANNGLECVNLMQSPAGKQVDMVLCDVEMPVMNGYEAVRTVKEWQSAQGLRPVPFLGVSANSRPEQIQKMLDAGMDKTIRKPAGRQDILDVVRSMLQSASSQTKDVQVDTGLQMGKKRIRSVEVMV